MKARLPIRLALGAIFLWAGCAKAAEARGFFLALLGYGLPVPDRLAGLVAVWFPWVEILCGLGLLLDCWRETVRPLAAGLCLLFVAMLGQALIRGLDLRCGCFGSSGAAWLERGDVGLVRALLLLAGSVYLLAESRAGDGG